MQVELLIKPKAWENLLQCDEARPANVKTILSLQIALCRLIIRTIDSRQCMREGSGDVIKL